MNFLESLAAEWLEYTGYLVLSNIRTRPLEEGGYEGEVDVLGYRQKNGGGEVVHIETSGDSDSWPKRKERFLTKKFVLSIEEYEDILGVSVQAVRKIAVVGQAKKPKVKPDWGESIEVWSIRELICQAAEEVRDKDLMSEGVPEKYPILRTMQMMVHYGVWVVRGLPAHSLTPASL